MNIKQETILQSILPKWFDLHYVKCPWKNVYWKYSDIPNKSFIYFDLLVNNQSAYELIIHSIKVAESTENVDSNSRSWKRFQDAINFCVNSHERDFPEECLEPLATFERTQLFNLIWLNKERFV